MLKEAILILLVVFAVGLQCNGTTGNFISEHSLGQQDEINDTTVKICPTIQIKNVANTFDQGSINLSNITLSCLFFDGSQVGKAGNSSITVSGGRIEFQTNFAITVNQSGTVKNGTGYASVFSDGTNFTKLLTYGSGRYLKWMLAQNTTKDVTASANFTLKRHSINISPQALAAINAALNTVNGSVKEQILTQYNSNFTNILNVTLTEEQIFNVQFNYTYTHPSLGELKIQFRNNISDFGLNATDGLMLEFDTYIIGETIDCQMDMPKHDSFEYFGGIQTIHTIEFYQHIFNYTFKQKWLNADLNTNWNTNAFQFYAGDLYEIIPKSASSIAPRTKLAGTCTAQNDTNLRFKRNGTEKFSAMINYNCEVYTETNIKVADFSILIDFILKIGLEYENIRLTILSATGTPTFKTAGEYVVTNFLLAQFKINEVLKSLTAHKVIGDGFQAWPRDHPNVDVRSNYTLFYDSSHVPHRSAKQ